MQLWTRRNALAALAGISILGGASLMGCSKSGSTYTGNGYSSDCDVRDYPVALRFIVDDELQWYTDTTGQMRLEALFAKYQTGKDRSQVSCSFDYVPMRDIAQFVQGGFSGYDAVIGFSDTLASGYESGTIEGGSSRLSVRTFPSALGVTMHVVTSESTPVSMPAAQTTNGKDSSDGSATQMHNIGQTPGSIAICDPDLCPEGIAANKMLSQYNLYSSNTSVDGTYDESIADKMVLFDSQDAAMEAVALGSCDFGFAFTAGLSTRYPAVTSCYTPKSCSMVFEGAALPECEEKGVARDFLQYLSTYAG